MVKITYKNPETRAKYMRFRYWSRIKQVRNLKQRIGKCKYCGWNKHTEILHFHHKGNKSFSISGHYIRNKSWEQIQKEIDKCDLICPNCHAWEHYKEPQYKIIKEYEKRIGNSKEKIIREIVKKGLNEGLSGYKISKKYNLNKKTVYNHINRMLVVA